MWSSDKILQKLYCSISSIWTTIFWRFKVEESRLFAFRYTDHRTNTQVYQTNENSEPKPNSFKQTSTTTTNAVAKYNPFDTRNVGNFLHQNIKLHIVLSGDGIFSKFWNIKGTDHTVAFRDAFSRQQWKQQHMSSLETTRVAEVFCFQEFEQHALSQVTLFPVSGLWHVVSGGRVCGWLCHFCCTWMLKHCFVR